MSIRLVSRQSRFGPLGEQPDGEPERVAPAPKGDEEEQSFTKPSKSMFRKMPLTYEEVKAMHARGLARLRAFEATTALFHLVQAIALAVLVTTKHQTLDSPISIPYVEWPARNATGEARHYAYPKPYHVGTFKIQWALFAFFMLSFFFQALAVSPLWYSKFEYLLLEHYSQPLRFVEYSISASLMILVFAVLDGVLDFTYMWLLFTAFFALQFFGMLSEFAIAVRKNAQALMHYLEPARALLASMDADSTSELSSFIAGARSKVRKLLGKA